MVLAANLQYGWTLFVLPMDAAHNWGRSAIQFGFTVFILTQTWLVPFEGYAVDRYGPRALAMLGGAFAALSWSVNAYADTLAMLYAGQCLGGVGAGIIATAAYGNALKWFEERRGLAVGLTAAGYGAGAALTVIPISWTIHAYGYQHAFLLFGLIQGGLIMLIACFLRAPRQYASERARAGISALQHAVPVFRSPVFWTMYVMFMLVAAGGLMASAQLAPMAHDFKVADVPVSAFGITMPALVFALALDRIGNGVSRPLFGWISDIIGRESTMCVAFLLEAAAVFSLMRFAHDPLLFVVLSGVVFLAWGEIFSLFPSLCTDVFGTARAAANYGWLYTAKGTAAFIVPYANVLSEGGHWDTVLSLVVAFDIVAALLAVALLLPLRRSLATAR
jgi:OFA family oxalate/formate antiporter-like MFS transporter